MVKRQTLTESSNQTISPIQAEHKRRVLAAIADHNAGRKEPLCRCVDCQLELFDNGKTSKTKR